ncbi:uncharacterized protein F5147DRAFT_780539 [Suillus discolor]|uniref:Uncharacterized protein n=1 Tax=Suillus discolor TaxID=1912936 RepID=A0A9P7JM87_9AGAM|nr:uncharacterized protein F5147DRAFT_780539 [Suillus discolor]KAG2089746.1 hypothetical protein F5147DRAFT_780539 [Suillus discolor]
MTPVESANDALNATLADVQSLMKRCMKLKEADPETFRLSDEIAQRVAKDLKLYMGTATSFSPLLLSCAAIIWQYSKAGTFESVPDWTSTVGYRLPSPAEFPANLDPQDAGSVTAVLSATDPVMPSSAPSALPSRQSLDNLIAATATEPEPGSPAPDPTAAGVQNLPHLPVKYNLFVVGTKKKPRKAAPQLGNSNKRKADNEDLDAAVVTDGPKLPPPFSRPRQKRKKKFQLADKDKVHTGTIFVKSKAALDNDSDAAGPHSSDVADDKSFLEVETRPAEWGQDSQIAMLWKHSIRYHPQQCNKCTKLDIHCVVLLDKKFRYTRLACANCDQMKITCAIDGVGVRQRMQAKAAAAVATSKPARNSRMRIKKSCTISKAPAKRTPAKPTRVELDISEEEKQQPAPANHADPEPTARDILQGIQDLSRRLDLLATNEWVDALEIRVHLVENTLHQQLDALEQRLNASDAW